MIHNPSTKRSPDSGQMIAQLYAAIAHTTLDQFYLNLVARYIQISSQSSNGQFTPPNASKFNKNPLEFCRSAAISLTKNPKALKELYADGSRFFFTDGKVSSHLLRSILGMNFSCSITQALNSRPLTRALKALKILHQPVSLNPESFLKQPPKLRKL